MDHTNTARTVGEATAVGAAAGALIGGLSGNKEDAKNGAVAGAAIGAAMGLLVADVQGGFAKQEKHFKDQISHARKQARDLKSENDRLALRIRRGVATKDDYIRQRNALKAAEQERAKLINMRPKARSDGEKRQLDDLKERAISDLDEQIKRAPEISKKRPTNVV